MESIDELRYATEFSPRTVAPKSDEPDAGKLNVDATIFEATPVQFEVRNTGVTLEVDPAVVEEGKLIQFAVAVQRVRLKGFNKISLEKPGDERKVVVEQPEFETTKTTTTLRLHNGERILLAVHKTSTLPSELEIYLLRVEATKVE
ncbi:MAG: hypothetical protein JWL59_4713 [Chthoniobacteraceae bacterium]|nr:hypothetical protein [Chthoniobacteraceae bacterium]